MNFLKIIWLEGLARDARYSLRSLRRSPGFTAGVVITLALCIGANTAIFSVLYSLILKPLPFRDAGQLVEIYSSLPKLSEPKRRVSVPQYLDYKANADLFEGFALWAVWTFNIGEESDPDRGIGARVTADYFQIAGVQPLLGRFYTMEESIPGNDAVLVLAQSYWEKRYGADPSVIGRVIRLGGVPNTIIGVAPRSLEALNRDVTIFKPFEWFPQQTEPQARAATSATLYARIKPGVVHAAALAQLATLEKRFLEDGAPPRMREFLDRGGFEIGLGQVRAEQTKSVRSSLLLLQGCAVFVLLLGCVNVANLMLARANARQGELALRQALGAGQVALARQMLVEGMLLAGFGSVMGLGLGWVSLRVINTYTASIVREVQPVVLDGAILSVALLSTFAVALLIALLPMIKTWRTNLLVSMQAGTRNASAGGGLRAMGGVLIAAQVALALVLLIGAGLLLRSFANVMAVDPGFDPQRVIQGRIAFNSSVQDAETARAVQDLILSRMREIPGVQSVGATGSFALSGRFPIISMPLRGSTSDGEDTLPRGSLIIASPEYFEVMGFRLLDGRVFTETDTLPDARRVYVVDQDFARKHFPGRTAVGEIIQVNAPNVPPEKWPMIVGVVTSAKLNGLEDTSGVPFVFAPMRPSGALSVVLRTSLPVKGVISAMREKLRTVDPSLPLYNVGSLEEGLDWLLANRRGVMWLLGAFAAIALLLSAVGIYGMLAYDVAQRTREIGIRGALGATRAQICGMILKQGLGKAGVGLVIGLVGAYYLSRFMSNLLFEVKPWDPLAYAAVTLVLLIVAGVASWLPARRAAKVDPMVALRAE